MTKSERQFALEVVWKQSFIAFVTIVWCICSQAQSPSEGRQCGLGADSAIHEILRFAQAKNLRVRALWDKEQEAKEDLESAGAQAAINPISVDFEGSRYRVSTPDDSTGISDRMLSLTSDLSPWRYKTRDKRLAALKNVKQLAVVTQQTTHARAVLDEVVGLLQHRELERILLERQQVLDKKLDYYATLRKSGQKVSREILLVEEKILENKNKITATRVKSSSSALKINLTIDNLILIPDFSLNKIQEDLRISCAVTDSISVMLASAQKKYIEALQAEQDAADLPRISFFSNYEYTKYASQPAGSKTLTSGIKVNVNLYSGGQSTFEVEERLRALDAVNRKLETAVNDTQLSILSWDQTLSIYTENLAALSSKRQFTLDFMVEILERSTLGDDVFLDLIDTSLQLSSTNEAILNARTQLIKVGLSVVADFMALSTSSEAH
ncbi:TolC family protein [Burkholderiaceae bacterium]|nr:TolC family protein [Burkholderiaceae bacterium]